MVHHLRDIVDELKDEPKLRVIFSKRGTHAWIEVKRGKIWVNARFVSNAQWLEGLETMLLAHFRIMRSNPVPHLTLYEMEQR
jgi:hypothetical protein